MSFSRGPARAFTRYSNMKAMKKFFRKPTAVDTVIRAAILSGSGVPIKYGTASVIK